VVGCGSDDTTEKTSTPFSSGIPADKTVDTLTDAEVTNLCSSLGQYISTDPGLQESTCHFAGFGVALSASLFGAASDADLQKMCADTEAKCHEAPLMGEGSTCTKPTSSCSATVGEFEACVTDSLAEATKAFAALPACSSITNASLQMLISSGSSGMTTAVAPASCQTLEQKCPGLQDTTGLNAVTDPSSP
jgi:hypothetical protein